MTKNRTSIREDRLRFPLRQQHSYMQVSVFYVDVPSRASLSLHVTVTPHGDSTVQCMEVMACLCVDIDQTMMANQINYISLSE